VSTAADQNLNEDYVKAAVIGHQQQPTLSVPKITLRNNKHVTSDTKSLRYYPSSWLVELTETMPIHNQNFPDDCSNQGHTKQERYHVSTVLMDKVHHHCLGGD
jgi:hypothetical protein